MWDLLIINPMTNLLLWIYSAIGGFGMAIIIFTILIRLLTYPLTAQQLKSAQAMQEMQKSKKWTDLAKKYKIEVIANDKIFEDKNDNEIFNFKAVSINL